MADFNIVFSSDIHYLPYCMVAMQSAVASLGHGRTASDEGQSCEGRRDQIIFNIIVDDSVDIKDFRSRCDAFISRNASYADLYGVDISVEIKPIDNSIFDGFSLWGANKTLSAYYRLMIDDLFSEEVSTILYLDVDMLITADLRPIFKTDLTGRVCACVNDTGIYSNSDEVVIKGKKGAGKDCPVDKSTYFNSGMMLINMQEWRRRKIRDQAIEFLRSHDTAFPDQDALNCVIPDPVLVSPAWNMQTSFYDYPFAKTNGSLPPSSFDALCRRTDKVGQWQLGEFIGSPCIVHYIRIKPWDSKGVFRADDSPLILTSDHLLWLSSWREIALQVPEFSEELKDAAVDPVAAANTALMNLHLRLIKSQDKRRKDRNLMLSLNALLLVLVIVALII